jgi:cardiolipin synthase
MNWLLIHQLAEWAIRLAMVPIVLRRRFLPATALAWLCIAFFLPEVGLVLYMLVGDPRLGRKRIRLHQKVIDASRKDGRMLRQKKHIIRPKIDRDLEPVILQAENIGGMPILGGSKVELMGDTKGLIDRIVADIDAARHHVHLIFYIFAPDETGDRVSQALIRAAGRGVACRLLVDSVGSLAFRRSSLAVRLREGGVNVHEALPARLWRAMLARIDLRNHRKLIVIDGVIGYTGSHNIVNADYGKGPRGRRLQWIDLSGRYAGPVVHQLQIVFMEDWAFDTGEQLESDSDHLLPAMEAVGEMAAQTVPTGPSEDGQRLPNVLLAAINAARRKVVITTPYFVPDEPTLVALLMAASRGVEVEIILPVRSDHWLVSSAGKFYYEPLLAAGVHIYQHHGGLLHSKTVTIDDAFALLGSTNMDVRSFYLNFELNVLMYGSQITRELRFAQSSYLAEATEIKLDVWRTRPLISRYAASAAALLSPLL